MPYTLNLYSVVFQLYCNEIERKNKVHVLYTAFLIVLNLNILFCYYQKIFGSSIPTFAEGNGTPLQYSCLENPMDGEAW